MIDFSDVVSAADRLGGRVHRTPVLTSAELDRRVGARVFLKAENFQRTGSFKVRGATNAVVALDEATRARGVVAFSSGNHAQAVAHAASSVGAPATIVMPHDAPDTKVAATMGYGAEVVRYDRYTEDRATIAADLAERTGATLIPPYDHPHVMAGQGTAALELITDAREHFAAEIDQLVVCVGGGGLIAGCATAARELVPEARVIGIEPEAGDDTRQSLAAGRRIEIDVPHTIADGQQVSAPGHLTFPVIAELVDAIELVSDAEIVEAMRFAFERLKIVLEPSGASALASVLNGRLDTDGATIGVTLSGGNVGTDRFVELLSSY